MKKIKILIFYIAKYLGFFHLARKITSKGIRIICYHGFSVDEEYIFRPQLFIRKELLAKRLDKISKMGFSVISLDEAVHCLKSGKPPQNALVITIDDGWQGVEDVAWPLFEKHGFAWTFYLATYYVQKQTQIMNIALQYLCWKTVKNKFDFSKYGIDPEKSSQLHSRSDFNNLAYDLTRYGITLDTAEDRQEFVRDIAVILDVDQSEIERKKMFYFVDLDTVTKMHNAGVDIQLHTHRHTLGGVDEDKISLEINDNRKTIKQVCSHTPVHFCYPSGFYEAKHFQWLSDNGVLSATTCNPGLNYCDTPLLELNRFLDGENISDIGFEAELSGFTELLRKLK